MAVRAYAVPTPVIGRRVASTQEVQNCNKIQWEMARDIVVKPDAKILQALGPK